MRTKKIIKYSGIIGTICSLAITIPFFTSISESVVKNTQNTTSYIDDEINASKFRREVKSSTELAVGDENIIRADPFTFTDENTALPSVESAVVNYSPIQFSTQTLSYATNSKYTSAHDDTLLTLSELNNGLKQNASKNDIEATKNTWSLATAANDSAPALWRWDANSYFGETKITQGYSQNPYFIFDALNTKDYGIGGSDKPKGIQPTSWFQTKNYEMLDLSWKDENPAKDVNNSSSVTKGKSDILSYVENLNKLYKFINRSGETEPGADELLRSFAKNDGDGEWKVFDEDGWLKAIAYNGSDKDFNGWNYLAPETASKETLALLNALISIRTISSDNTSFNNQNDVNGANNIQLNFETNPLMIYAMANLSNAQQFYYNNLNLPYFHYVPGKGYYELFQEAIGGVTQYYARPVLEKTMPLNNWSNENVKITIKEQIYNRSPLSDLGLIEMSPSSKAPTNNAWQGSERLTEIDGTKIRSLFTTGNDENGNYDWNAELLKQIPNVITKVIDAQGSRVVETINDKAINQRVGSEAMVDINGARKSNYFFNPSDVFAFSTNDDGKYKTNPTTKAEHYKKKRSLELIAPNNRNLISPFESPMLWNEEGSSEGSAVGQKAMRSLIDIRDVILTGAVVSKSEVNTLSHWFGTGGHNGMENRKYHAVGGWSENGIYNPFSQDELFVDMNNAVFKIKQSGAGTGTSALLRPSIWWDIAKEYKLSIDTFQRLMNINSKMLLNIDLSQVKSSTIQNKGGITDFNFFTAKDDLRKRLSLNFETLLEKWGRGDTRSRAAFKIIITNSNDVDPGVINNDTLMLKKEENSIFQSITQLGQGLFLSNPFVVNKANGVDNLPTLWTESKANQTTDQGFRTLMGKYIASGSKWKIQHQSYYLQSPNTNDKLEDINSTVNPNFGFGSEKAKTIFAAEQNTSTTSPYVLNTPFVIATGGSVKTNIFKSDPWNLSTLYGVEPFFNYINYMYGGQYNFFGGANKITNYSDATMQTLQNTANVNITAQTKITKNSGIPLNETYAKATNLRIENFSNAGGLDLGKAINAENTIQSHLLTNPFSTEMGSFRNYWLEKQNDGKEIFQKVKPPLSWSNNSQMWFWFTKGFRIQDNAILNAPNWCILNSKNKNLETISRLVIDVINNSQETSEKKKVLVDQIALTVNTLPSLIVGDTKTNELWRKMIFENQIKVSNSTNTINELLKGYFYTISGDIYNGGPSDKPTLKDLGLTERDVQFKNDTPATRKNRWGEFAEGDFTGFLQLFTTYNNLRTKVNGISGTAKEEAYKLRGFAKRLWFDFKNNGNGLTFDARNIDSEIDYELLANTTPQQIVASGRKNIIESSILINTTNDGNLNFNNYGVSTNLSGAFLENILRQQNSSNLAFNVKATDSISTGKRYGAALLMEADSKKSNTLKIRLILKNEDRMKIPVGTTLNFGDDLFFIDDKELERSNPDTTEEERKADIFTEYNFTILNVGHNVYEGNGSSGGDGTNNEKPAEATTLEALTGRLTITTTDNQQDWEYIKKQLRSKNYLILNELLIIRNEQRVWIQPTKELWGTLIKQVNFDKELDKETTLIFTLKLTQFLETGNNFSFDTIDVFENKVSVGGLTNVKEDLQVWETKEILLMVFMSVFLASAIGLMGFSFKKWHNKKILKK